MQVRARREASTAPAPRLFDETERAALEVVARAAMPAGAVFPGAGAACVEKMERFLSGSPRSVQTGYRAMLRALDVAALLAHRRRLHRLSVEQAGRLLEKWRGADYGRRMLLRLLTIPLKVAHYNDPAIFQAVGCRWGSLPVAAEARPRYLSERVTTARELAAGGAREEHLECDVVVIGTGAGGAVVARELAERGHAVVMIEEGDWHQRQDFTGHAIEMQKKLYRDMGMTTAVGNVAIPIPIGRGVGGTTTINSGTCYRAPARILDDWREKHGIAGMSAESMDPYYARVEEVLGVTEAELRYVGGVGRVVARGCDALGWKHAPLRRNAPACDGQGVCCFGCPTDAKRSTNVSYVPLALKAGAQLFTGLRVERVLSENGRAVGVEASGAGVRLTVRAKAVAVACGTLLTPLLLGKSGIGTRSGQLGRNLTIHPAVGAMAIYDEVIDGQNAIPQGYAIEEFHQEGLLFEGAFAPLDVGAASFPLLGRRLVELLEGYRHLACFGLMIEDTSRGRVRAGRDGRPLVTYWLNDHDVGRLKRGIELLARVYFAGGARRVVPLVNGFDELTGESDLARFRAARLTARDFEITAYHPLGTAGMGADPRRSVIGTDHQVHDTRGVYVTDGSAVPSSPAVNPQLTIMALATRAAEHIDRALA
jgi:choline dehydrogenase-like flavoprotein